MPRHEGVQRTGLLLLTKLLGGNLVQLLPLNLRPYLSRVPGLNHLSASVERVFSKFKLILGRIGEIGLHDNIEACMMMRVNTHIN